MIEAWWGPDRFVDRYVAGDVVAVDGRTIARVSHTVRQGAHSRMEVHWVVADAAGGAHHTVERHELALFDPAQYRDALRDSGCRVEHIRPPWSGPGLVVGVLDGPLNPAPSP